MTSYQLYHNMPFGICILKLANHQLRVVYANPAMIGIMGYEDKEPIEGRPFTNAWTHREAGKLAQLLLSETPPKDYTLPNRDSGSGMNWIHLEISREKRDGDECFVIWAVDATPSIRRERQLMAEIERADALAEMKSNFLATMSHEIRTPMQSIYGLLELIADEKPDQNIATMVSTAQNSASGLLEILDDILDLAQMDADKMTLDIFEVPVRLLVRGTLEALAVKVHGKDVKLIDDIAEDVPFVVIGDPKRLRQIIMNLTGNAMKFTHEGSVTVRVSTDVQHITPAHDHIGLRFEVIDTGIGMSEEACNRLFQSFVQADNSTSRKYGGTGLGLSISKKLVELMGGQIGVTSTPDVGSTFWFEIPTQEVDEKTTIVELPNLEGISVLSVEDHPQGAKEIVNSLRSMGATVESCATYKDGLELARRRPFDVAIIDQGLPDGLGLDLMKEIIALRPTMGMIMYTVRDDIGLAHSLQALGAKFLTKPASRAGLGEAVKDASSQSHRLQSDGPCRILIAEDTASVRDVLQRQLEKLDVEADFVENGQEALKALESGKYGLLISDLHMPDMDGYALTQTIRDAEKDTDKHLPIIALTADVQIAQRDVYLGHGFDECLLKPVSLGQFRGLLMRWGLIGEQKTIEPERSNPAIKNHDDDVIDKKAMIQQMGAFDAGAIEMLGLFIQMSAPQIEKIITAQEAKDVSALKELGHSLKGGARSACLPMLGDAAAALQDAAENNQDTTNIVKEVEAEFKRAKEAIARLKTP